MALALGCKPVNNFYFCFINTETVEHTRVDHYACSTVCKRFFLNVAALYYLDNRKVELFRELPVAGIVRRNSHNCACTVRYQNIVRNKNRDFLVVNGVDRLNAVKQNACFILGNLSTLKVGLSCGSCLISSYLVHISELIRPLFNKRMLGRNNHICSAVKCVGSCCVDCKSVACCGCKIYLSACTSADPVFLLSLYALGIIYKVKIIDKSVGVLGDFEHPLALYLVNYLASAAFANAVYNFLIGKNALT